jgi:uncharacterized C2H2 Zn-finger protein
VTHENISHPQKHNRNEYRTTLTSKYLLSKHIRAMHARSVGEPYQFSHCSYSTKQKGHFDNHKVSHRDKPFMCEDCGMSYTHQSSLTRHVKLNHRGKTFECKECEKKFKDKINLSTHIRESHNWQRPFKCRECNWGFDRRSDCKKHEINVHNSR